MDAVVAAVLVGLSVTGLAYHNSLPDFAKGINFGWGVLQILVAGFLIIFRRQYPILVLLLCTGVHFIVVGILNPFAAGQAGMQVLYFLALYSAMAWARDREVLLLSVGCVLLAMVVWISVTYSSGFGDALVEGPTTTALLAVLFTLSLNVAYFGTAVMLGRNAWLMAKAGTELETSRNLIEAQARELSQQAVLSERLRIARDLHDSVAHHISLIGVRSAAARRVLKQRPEEVAPALVGIEQASREAISDMRSMLHSLRDADDSALCSDLSSVLQECSSQPGLKIEFNEIGDSALASRLSPMQLTTIRRAAQEALTNVRTHSRATSASVSLRYEPSYVEAEILDDGPARQGTSGGRLGHVGIRERVSALGGSYEIGPRNPRGYRVRLRLPIQDSK